MKVLEGVKVLEFAGLAPVPYCGLILADFGADVIRIDRIGAGPFDLLGRGKRSVGVNLKSPEGVATVMRMAEQADVLIEPFRPGVMERLGLGPDVLAARNPRLVYARLTGWGQTGAYAPMAGHDINYIAISGALSLIGRKGERPVAPVNLLGDFAGGGMLCAMGILLALLERHRSGKGQVVDSAMVDGAAYISAVIFKLFGVGWWKEEKGTNMLDTAAHFYDTYETKDGKYVSVGAIEPQFYAALLTGLGLDPATLPDQNDQSQWDAMRERFAAVFKTRTRDEWSAVFDDTDACVAPILSLSEVAKHPHNRDRGVLVPDEKGRLEAAPAPRLSRTPGRSGGPAPAPGQHTNELLAEFGFSKDEVAKLSAAGAVG